MSSKLGALVRHFRDTDADALYLVPGERIFVTRGSQKLVVGREPLSDESFRAVAAEAVPDSGTDSLARRRYRIPLTDAGEEDVDVQFGVVNGIPALMLTRSKREEEEPAPPFSVAVPFPTGVIPAVPSPSVSVARPVRPRSDGAPPPSVSLRGPVGSGGPAGGAASLPAFLASMARLGASDGYLAAGAIPHVRVDGQLLAAEENEALDASATERLLGPLLPEARRRELSESGGARFVHDEPGVGRFRVLGFRDRNGIGAVFRPIPHPPPTPGELELPDPVARLASAEPGLVLVAGPSGSGRSTTLAALLEAVNGSRACRIVTVEEPIEYLHPGRLSVVSQREAGSGGATLGSHLAAALREAPDVLVVGPELDGSTAPRAVEAAASGSLVLATRRASSGAAALDELSSLLPEAQRRRLGEVLKGVVYQKLCRGAAGGRRALFAVAPGGAPMAARLRSGEGELPWSIRLDDSLFELARRGAVATVEALALADDRAALLACLASARTAG